MKLSTMMAAAAAASLMTVPALAAPAGSAANPAAGLSVAKSVRAGTPAKGKSKLAGGGLIIAVVGAIAVIVSIIIIADSGSDSP